MNIEPKGSTPPRQIRTGGRAYLRHAARYVRPLPTKHSGAPPHAQHQACREVRNGRVSMAPHVNGTATEPHHRFSGINRGIALTRQGMSVLPATLRPRIVPRTHSGKETKSQISITERMEVKGIAASEWYISATMLSISITVKQQTGKMEPCHRESTMQRSCRGAGWVEGAEEASSKGKKPPSTAAKRGAQVPPNAGQGHGGIGGGCCALSPNRSSSGSTPCRYCASRESPK